MVPYHNQSVIDRIAEEESISAELAERYLKGARQFLEVAASVPVSVSPSIPIDAGWHAFILHTKDYAEYCQEQFGRFIHHQPTSGVSNRDNYLRARAIAEERFSDLDETIWPTKVKKVSACSDPDGECSSQCSPENAGKVLATATVGDCHGDGHCGSASCADST